MSPRLDFALAAEGGSPALPIITVKFREPSARGGDSDSGPVKLNQDDEGGVQCDCDVKLFTRSLEPAISERNQRGYL